MTNCIRYTCASDLLPVVEAALALDGYQVELPRQQSIGGASALIMSRSSTFILLGADSPRSRGLIEVWGAQQAEAAQILEALPIALIRQLRV
jgi:hypothetical protein